MLDLDKSHACMKIWWIDVRPLNSQNLCKKKEKKDVTKYRINAAARNGTRVAVQKK